MVTAARKQPRNANRINSSSSNSSTMTMKKPVRSLAEFLGFLLSVLAGLSLVATTGAFLPGGPGRCPRPRDAAVPGRVTRAANPAGGCPHRLSPPIPGIITTITTTAVAAAVGEGPTGPESPVGVSPPRDDEGENGHDGNDNDDTGFGPVTYRIRDCDYRELAAIAALVVESFYDSQKTNNVVARKLYQLAETNRLQQNFPYPDSRTVHRMLVVEAIGGNDGNADDDGNGGEPSAAVVGFCDVDTRPCATKVKLPRPYLSDLAVDPGHRRRGLARKLVEAAEDFVRTPDRKKGSGGNGGGGDELWIRVASDNAAALGLYRDKLGYTLADWSTGEEPPNKPDNNSNNGNEPEVLTLRKNLRSL